MIDLDTASRLVDGALEHARAHDMAPMTVATGASGDLSDNDEACLVAAIEAVGLRADPGDPDG